MVEVYIDGASSGNPGPSGAGVFIKTDSGVEEISIPLGIMSNHEAEFQALIHGLSICIEKNYNVVSFRSDSSLVVDAIEKQYVRNSLYQPLLQDALRLIEQVQLFFIKWIPAKNNKKADNLAKKAIHLNK